jgi:hypothetical protein
MLLSFKSSVLPPGCGDHIGIVAQLIYMTPDSKLYKNIKNLSIWVIDQFLQGIIQVFQIWLLYYLSVDLRVQIIPFAKLCLKMLK